MSLQPRDYIGRALEFLAVRLEPLVVTSTGSPSPALRTPAPSDPQIQLKRIIADWDLVFRDRLPRGMKTKIHELVDLRNKWAHGDNLEWSDAYRAIDSALHLLRAAGGSDLAEIEEYERQLIETRASTKTQAAESATPGEMGPRLGPTVGQIAVLWFEATTDDTALMRGVLRCPTCSATVQIVAEPNVDALTEKQPWFFLLDAEAVHSAQPVGHLFVGTIRKSPVLYYGGVKHCGDERRLVAFFNRSFRTHRDPHLVLVAQAAGKKVEDESVPF